MSARREANMVGNQKSDRWEKFLCLKPRFVSGKTRWLTHLERKYVDCIGAYDNDGNDLLSFACEVKAGYVYRLPGGVPRGPMRIFCCGCGFLSSSCECDDRMNAHGTSAMADSRSLLAKVGQEGQP